MNYALGHAFRLHDIFMNFPVRKLKMTPQQCKEVYSDGNKRDLAASIFAKCLELVVDDIIENNTHFKFPTMGKKSAYLYMKRTHGDKFKKAFKNGKWRDIDFIMSDFSGYQIHLKIEDSRKLSKEKPVYICGEYKQKLTDNINKGMQY